MCRVPDRPRSQQSAALLVKSAAVASRKTRHAQRALDCARWPPARGVRPWGGGPVFLDDRGGPMIARRMSQLAPESTISRTSAGKTPRCPMVCLKFDWTTFQVNESAKFPQQVPAAAPRIGFSPAPFPVKLNALTIRSWPRAVTIQQPNTGSSISLGLALPAAESACNVPHGINRSLRGCTRCLPSCDFTRRAAPQNSTSISACPVKFFSVTESPSKPVTGLPFTLTERNFVPAASGKRTIACGAATVESKLKCIFPACV